MTIKQMKNIAKDKINYEIAYLAGDLTTASQVRAILCAYFYVGLISDDEYREYCDWIRQAENKRISQNDF